jgi:UDP-GlcNAc:undecaprenyl-phosphate/decaprenyl-phosphate GlcNAc-1-phosphate transferase
VLILFDLACIAFLFALVLSPLVRDFCRRLGLVDRPDQIRKMHREAVPRLGGVAIAFAYTLALAFVVVAPYRGLDLDIPRTLARGLALVPAAAVVFLTGLWDDIRGLRPWQKLSGQVIAAVLAYTAGFGIHVLRGQPLADWVSLPITVLWLVGCSNALNLIDGMDGLAAGVGFFAATTMLVAALLHENVELALVTAPLVGALLGFLRYNFNPASIFLGDSGSLLIGFLLGCYGAAWSQKSATVLGMTAPLMALSIPLLEVALSVVRRFLRNKPIFEGDRGHIHHKLLEQGMTPRRAALILYAFCGAAAALSLLHEVTYNRFGGLIIVLFCGAAWIGVQHLGYAEFGTASRLLLGGTLRGIIDVQLRLQQFERDLASAASAEALWQRIWSGCQQFGFQGVRMRIEGQVWERHLEDPDKPGWQLRIPLSRGQYVNFYRSLESHMHPWVLSGFAEIVERVVGGRNAAAPSPAAIGDRPHEDGDLDAAVSGRAKGIGA